MAARFTQSNNDLAGTIAQMGGYITKAVNDRMEQKMNEVLRESKARAPREKGNLEDAIKLSKDNYRRQWTVYVDEDEPDDTGKYTVGTYAMRLHEGVWTPGPGTLAKGPKAGRKYLENPFREIITQSLMDELQTLLASEISKRGSR